jgi:uncharacterized protein (TIGR02145 family)
MLKFGNTFVNFGGTYLAGVVSPPAPVGDEVTIGTQTWKNQDLSGTDGGTGISVVDGKYYYTLAAAKRMVPDGWHIPAKSEYETLLNYIGTNACQKLKTTTGWLDKDPGDGGGTGNGTDEYDFHGAPVGYNYGGTVNGIGEYVYYMTTTTGSTMMPYSQYMYTLLLDRDEDGARLSQMNIDSSTYFAVRLVKD